MGKNFRENFEKLLIYIDMKITKRKLIKLIEAALGRDVEELEVPRYVFHGSPYEFDEFELRDHYHLDRPGVFAADNIEQALCSLQPWNDDQFEQGVVGEDPLYFFEKEPGLFKEVYEGKEGWLYVLEGETFEHEPQLMRTEVVSYVVPKIVKVYYIEDSLAVLRASDLLMFPYEKRKQFERYIEGDF